MNLALLNRTLNCFRRGILPTFLVAIKNLKNRLERRWGSYCLKAGDFCSVPSPRISQGRGGGVTAQAGSRLALGAGVEGGHCFPAGSPGTDRIFLEH